MTDSFLLSTEKGVDHEAQSIAALLVLVKIKMMKKSTKAGKRMRFKILKGLQQSATSVEHRNARGFAVVQMRWHGLA